MLFYFKKTRYVSRYVFVIPVITYDKRKREISENEKVYIPVETPETRFITLIVQSLRLRSVTVLLEQHQTVL